MPEEKKPLSVEEAQKEWCRARGISQEAERQALVDLEDAKKREFDHVVAAGTPEQEALAALWPERAPEPPQEDQVGEVAAEPAAKGQQRGSRNKQ